MLPFCSVIDEGIYCSVGRTKIILTQTDLSNCVPRLDDGIYAHTMTLEGLQDALLLEGVEPLDLKPMSLAFGPTLFPVELSLALFFCG